MLNIMQVLLIIVSFSYHCKPTVCLDYSKDSSNMELFKAKSMFHLMFREVADMEGAVSTGTHVYHVIAWLISLKFRFVPS